MLENHPDLCKNFDKEKFILIQNAYKYLIKHHKTIKDDTRQTRTTSKNETKKTNMVYRGKVYMSKKQLKNGYSKDLILFGKLYRFIFPKNMKDGDEINYKIDGKNIRLVVCKKGLFYY